MRIKDIYKKETATISADADLLDTVKAFQKFRTNGLVVIDENGKVVGLMTSNDLIQAIIPDYLKGINTTLASFTEEGLFHKCCNMARHKKVRDIMTPNVPTVTPDMKIIEVAANVMQPERIRLPVVDKEGNLIGIVTRTQIRHAIAHALDVPVD